jgi:peroxiredoxin (alkyl hydroperoxide reductase subunit C)
MDEAGEYYSCTVFRKGLSYDLGGLSVNITRSHQIINTMKKLLSIVTVLCFSVGLVTAQEQVLIPQLGSEAPSFSAVSTNGSLNFPQDFGRSWKILFSHPKDFTPVCSSELLELAQEQKNFEKMDVKLAVLSTDILDQHKDWKRALETISYKGHEPVEIRFPLIADPEFKVSDLYGMLHDRSSVSQNIRGVYIIDPDNHIRSIQFYPNNVGRNMEEIKRTVMALQATYQADNLATPANWHPGDDFIVPVLTSKQKEELGKDDSDYYQFDWFLTFEKVKK